MCVCNSRAVGDRHRRMLGLVGCQPSCRVCEGSCRRRVRRSVIEQDTRCPPLTSVHLYDHYEHTNIYTHTSNTTCSHLYTNIHTHKRVFGTLQ